MRLSGILCAAVAFLLYDCAATTIIKAPALSDSTNKDTRSLRGAEFTGTESEDGEERTFLNSKAVMALDGMAQKLKKLPKDARNLPAKIKQAQARKRLQREAKKIKKMQDKLKALGGDLTKDKSFPEFIKMLQPKHSSFSKLTKVWLDNNEVSTVYNLIDRLNLDDGAAIKRNIELYVDDFITDLVGMEDLPYEPAIKSKLIRHPHCREKGRKRRPEASN